MNILWDFDGTLFDTYPAYTDILYEVLEGRASKPDIYEHLKISFTHAIDHYALSEDQIKRVNKLGQELLPENTPPFPHVENILKLAEVNVIMTHKPRNEVMRILEHYGWVDYFEDIVAGDDGYPKKPDPASYLFLHQKYRVDLVIGDRELDIIPGKLIGAKTCLFQNDTPGADYYLSSYEDFFNYLIETN